MLQTADAGITGGNQTTHNTSVGENRTDRHTLVAAAGNGKPVCIDKIHTALCERGLPVASNAAFRVPRSPASCLCCNCLSTIVSCMTPSCFPVLLPGSGLAHGRIAVRTAHQGTEPLAFFTDPAVLKDIHFRMIVTDIGVGIFHNAVNNTAIESHQI